MRHQFVRSLAGSRDPNFKNVTLLLHGDGTNGGQNNTFLDSSSNNFAITKRGNVAQGTFTPFGTRWSNYFDGAASFLRTPANAAFQLGTGDFSVDLWFYQNGSTATIGTRAIFGIGNSGQAGDIQLFNWWPFGGNPANTLALNSSAGGTLVVTNTAYLPNTWNYVAISRASGVVSIYLNGVRVANASFTTNASYNILTIGRPYTNLSQEHWYGYISNFRLVKGVALYSGININVPTSPFSTIANTSLLTCDSNSFVDNSTNKFTLTRSGSPIVTKFSPFAPESPYFKEIYGGSARFYGFQDGLSIADNSQLALGGANFTIEGWVFNDNYDTRAILLGNGWSFYKWNDDLMFRYTVGGVALSLSSLHPRGRWVHFATVREGNTLRLYFNGIQVNSTTLTSVIESSAGVARIGDEGSNNCFNGWISSTRVTIGTCLYPSGTTFNVPTAPFSALRDTKLLLNFTNGSIVDSSMTNSLETVGNAQISTAIKKYGTGSMYFDGTGDYLITWFGDNSNAGGSGIVVPSQFTFAGDFTIEAWVYIAAGGANRGIVTIGDRNTTTGLSLLWESSTVFKLYGNASQQILGTVSGLSLNTWAHIAVTRSGTGVGNIKMYLDGVYQSQTGTANNTVFAGSSANHICVGISYNNATFIEPLNGYIDELRITNGVARYQGTTNFTPPTAPFPDF